VDLLTCGNSEQWRERVGRLWGVRYEEHSADELPTADARIVGKAAARRASRHADSGRLGMADPPNVAADRINGSAEMCFPMQYSVLDGKESDRCVPQSSVSMVKRRLCEDVESLGSDGCAVHDTFIHCPSRGASHAAPTASAARASHSQPERRPSAADATRKGPRLGRGSGLATGRPPPARGTRSRTG